MGLVCLGFLCRFVPLCERMLTLSCFWWCLQVCVRGGFIGTSVVAPVLAVGLFLLGNYTSYFFFNFRASQVYNI